MFVVLFFYLLAIETRRMDLRSMTGEACHTRKVENVGPVLSKRRCARVDTSNGGVVRCSFGANGRANAVFSMGATHSYDVGSFSSCVVSPSRGLVLVRARAGPVCHHSFATGCCVFGMGGGGVRPLSRGNPRRIPLFSPSNGRVTFMHSGGVCLMGLLFNGDRSRMAGSNGFGRILGNVPS